MDRSCETPPVHPFNILNPQCPSGCPELAQHNRQLHLKFFERYAFWSFLSRLAMAEIDKYFGPLQTAQLESADVRSSGGVALHCKQKTAYATVQLSGNYWMVPSSSLA
jgi:hypothetical protein